MISCPGFRMSENRGFFSEKYHCFRKFVLKGKDVTNKWKYIPESGRLK